MRTSSAFVRSLFTSLLALLLASTPAFGQAPATDELAKLRQENQTLKEENQRLRNLLIGRQAATPAPFAPAPARSVPLAPQSPPAAGQLQGLTHWMTISSGKRHNSSCRYFHA